jgi:general secretion pathway protein G
VIRRGNSGFTLAELVMVVALVAVLSSMALPVAKFTVKRSKEVELRLALRQVRTAIDEYKRLSDQGMIPVKIGGEGYPESLDELVEGVEIVGQETKRRFLRRIPLDPMTHDDWELRSYQDDMDATSWGGENVYDIRTSSEGVAIDGTKYAEW